MSQISRPDLEAQQQANAPSVVDTPLQAAYHWAVRTLLGSPDQIPIAPNVSAFAGQPEARALMTTGAMSRLRAAAKAMGLAPADANEVEAVALRHPRVVAQQDIAAEAMPAASTRGSFVPTADDTGMGVVTLNQDPAPAAMAAKAGSTPAKTFRHELLHGAQNASLKGAYAPLYSALHTKVGYTLNPLEMSARGEVASAVPGIAEILGPDAIATARRLAKAGMAPDDIAKTLLDNAAGQTVLVK